VSKFKLIEISNVKLNLKYSGEYDKFKVAKKIALAVNQAKTDNFHLDSTSWQSIFNKKFKEWIINHDNNWCGILGAVLLYSDCNFVGSRIEAVANILGVEKEWILGFLYTLNGNYKSLVNKICKRKSKKGQHCRDGREFGSLFKLAYLTDRFFINNFYTTSKEKFNTHKWEILEECKTFMTLSMNFNSNIKKCTECNMYGGRCSEYNSNLYYINENWNDTRYRYLNNVIDLTCNEIIIKRLLS
jgi:hypothetical protein